MYTLRVHNQVKGSGMKRALQQPGASWPTCLASMFQLRVVQWVSNICQDKENVNEKGVGTPVRLHSGLCSHITSDFLTLIGGPKSETSDKMK